MKKIAYLFSVVSILVSSNVFAFINDSGPYVGGQVGWGRIDEGDGYKNFLVKNATANNIEQGTFTGWRAYIGYNFVPMFSIESGYTYYPSNTYTDTSDNSMIDVQTYAIDLVGKLIIPLDFIPRPFMNLSLYAKGGGAYVRTKINNSFYTPSSDKTNNAIRPTYGAGLILNFTDNIAFDASWTGIYGDNKVNSAADIGGGNPVPTCNLFTLGLSYKITGLF